MKYTSILLIASSLLFFACESEKLEPMVIGELPTNVSFKDSILPIFEKSCATSGCHNAGGIAPDLSTANAFNAVSFGGYIDKTTPENSSLYTRMIDNSRPMPPGGILPQHETSLVLGWVTEGAENN